jgi:23S rRNA pseudouridine2605 synthase
VGAVDLRRCGGCGASCHALVAGSAGSRASPATSLVKERLQKILARAGHGSRRAAETLITDGRVRVNGAVVSELGAQADRDADVIEVDGHAIAIAAAHVYLAMNKPAGVLTTATDPQHRRTVTDLLPAALPPHMFPIGRLDRDTEGLLLFTNDGEFAHRMANPRYQIDKEYFALVSGTPDRAALEALRAGVVIEGKRTSPAAVETATPPQGFAGTAGHTWLRLVIHEGRKRQVRLMCASVGHPVKTLVRTRIGGVTLARLARGKTRALADREVAELRALVGMSPPRAP